MIPDRPISRMTLRELLTHAGRLNRDVSDLTNKTLETRLQDLHELSRPTRRRTQYPTTVSFLNAVQRFGESSEQLLKLLTSLDEHFEAIREQAQRARLERRG